MAVALYYLADEGRMRKVANSFDIEKWTISKIIRRVLFLPWKNFPLYLFNKSNITISQTDKVRAEDKGRGPRVEEHKHPKNLSNIMETWY